MSLNERLQQLKTASRSKLPEEAAAIMASATERLEESGIRRMALGPGRPAPDFVLEDCQGQMYSSRELLTKGPIILTFYRGSW